jgi:hypothetical protein
MNASLRRPSLEVFEIPNTFTPDMSFEEQIAEGICDWQVDLPNGHVYFGRSRDEAIANAQAGECWA